MDITIEEDDFRVKFNTFAELVAFKSAKVCVITGGNRGIGLEVIVSGIGNERGKDIILNDSFIACNNCF